MRILVTGGAGFIGSKLVCELIKHNHKVTVIDNMNPYYNPQLKMDRLSVFCNGAEFIQGDIADKETLETIFKTHIFDKIVNLAAQAGVRYSITHPYDYVNSNILGFLNILEACRHYNIEHLVYASSSSIYGLNEEQPFEETDNTDRPVSLYAASKKSNELMAHAYCKLYGIPCTGLRFFTVYGPYGRPDMAPILFADAISKGEAIKVFNNGESYRDFTYIDDIVGGLIRVIEGTQKQNKDGLCYGVYNIGCGHKEKLMSFIEVLEGCLGKKANKIFLPMQQGDVVTTYASTVKLENDFGYKPSISINKGVPLFVEWYKEYYK
jgi:UDP-glucuronate 4-epimerase